jgi:hypothetical protein
VHANLLPVAYENNKSRTKQIKQLGGMPDVILLPNYNQLRQAL